MRPDPKRRKDNRCALKGCTNPLPEITARHRRYGGDVLLFEPFCSTEHCREYHGTTLAKPTREPGPDITSHSGGGANFRHGTRKGFWLCACPACVEAARRG